MQCKFNTILKGEETGNLEFLDYTNTNTNPDTTVILGPQRFRV